MKIAIIGAPGSGKTAVGDGIGKTLGNTPYGLIDGYAERWAEDSHFALGLLGGYVVNVGIALERIKAERQCAAESNSPIITCGSLLETATYASMSGVVSLDHASEEAEKEDQLRRIKATMNIFACLYIDTFHYDHVFYLPPRAVKEPWNKDAVMTFDQNLQVAFQAFNLTPVEPLVGETVKDQVEAAMEKINAG